MKRLVLLVALAAPLMAQTLSAQDSSGARQQGRGGRPTRDPHRAGPLSPWRGAVDSVRERQLYVSKDPKDLRGCSAETCERDLANKRRTDSVYAAKAAGNYEFSKIKYKSRADGLEIPAYLFSPINKGTAKHAALVWEHRIRRRMDEEDRLRRERSRRRAVVGRLSRDAGVRRQPAPRHHGLEPRRIHHVAHSFPRRQSVQGWRGHRASDQPDLPTERP